MSDTSKGVEFCDTPYKKAQRCHTLGYRVLRLLVRHADECAKAASPLVKTTVTVRSPQSLRRVSATA
jgi:hypothetical protein